MKMPHVHDYEMEFDDPRKPMSCVYRCKCGDTVATMQEAMDRTRQSGVGIRWALVAVVCVIGLLASRVRW